MSNNKRNRLLIILALALLVGGYLVLGPEGLPPGGRRRLPTGPVTPVLAMAPTHGLIIAGDGSLWSWGSTKLGVLGLGTISNTPYLHRIGNDKNWVNVRTGPAYTLALKSDGSIWLWGQSNTPQLMTSADALNGVDMAYIWNEISVLKSSTRVPALPSANRQDAAPGAGMLLRIKSDGTLWGLGGPDHLYDGDKKASATNATRIGTDSDWKSVQAGAEAISFLLTKKDDSVWELDVWQALHTGGFVHPEKVQFKRVSIPGTPIALGTAWFGAGVALGTNGEVWTWGEMLGTNEPAHPRLQTIAKWAKKIHLDVHWGDAHPIVREKPWFLPNIDPDAAAGK